MSALEVFPQTQGYRADCGAHCDVQGRSAGAMGKSAMGKGSMGSTRPRLRVITGGGVPAVTSAGEVRYFSPKIAVTSPADTRRRPRVEKDAEGARVTMIRRATLSFLAFALAVTIGGALGEITRDDAGVDTATTVVSSQR